MSRDILWNASNSEPDTIWWKHNRMADFDQMNAYYLEQLSELLKKTGFNQVEYIATENKGFRANGERHPHSWSIVDKKELIDWITESKRCTTCCKVYTGPPSFWLATLPFHGAFP
jgi:hypothetical protein